MDRERVKESAREIEREDAREREDEREIKRRIGWKYPVRPWSSTEIVRFTGPTCKPWKRRCARACRSIRSSLFGGLGAWEI